MNMNIEHRTLIEQNGSNILLASVLLGLECRAPAGARGVLPAAYDETGSNSLDFSPPLIDQAEWVFSALNFLDCRNFCSRMNNSSRRPMTMRVHQELRLP